MIGGQPRVRIERKSRKTMTGGDAKTIQEIHGEREKSSPEEGGGGGQA